MNKQPLMLAFTTAPSREVAENLARVLVENRIVACVNLLPGISSIYFWQDKLENSEEILLIMKCPKANIQALEKALSEHHPYEVPELVALEVDQVSSAYLGWVMKNTLS